MACRVGGDNHVEQNRQPRQDCDDLRHRNFRGDGLRLRVAFEREMAAANSNRASLEEELIHEAAQ